MPIFYGLKLAAEDRSEKDNGENERKLLIFIDIHVHLLYQLFKIPRFRSFYFTNSTNLKRLQNTRSENNERRRSNAISSENTMIGASF